jgi:hypothetical protein
VTTTVRNFAITVPAGTPIATPQLTNMTLRAGAVRHVRVRMVGWQLASAGSPFLPYSSLSSPQWIVGDNEIIEWDVEGLISSGAWQLRAYNTGVYDHILYVMFTQEITHRVSRPAQPMPLTITPG